MFFFRILNIVFVNAELDDDTRSQMHLVFFLYHIMCPLKSLLTQPVQVAPITSTDCPKC